MIPKFITTLLFLSTIILIFAPTSALAQNGSIPARNSQITTAQMPGGAQRLLPESVPVEFTKAFDNILRQGAGKIAGGNREFLVWSGNFNKASNIAGMTGQIRANFSGAGWEYEGFGKMGDVDVFSLYREGSPRRVVMGFFVPGGDVLVCALMEVVSPGADGATTPKTVAAKTQGDQRTTNSGTTGAKVVNAEKNRLWVNVMGNEMPLMPQFPQLAPKPGRVRGYVRDWTGKPLAGASIGVRASYFAGQYSGAQGVTDAKGYYEFIVPKGSAHFYNAGYQLEWGSGLAAVSLHPADGALDQFTTADGAVENFVLLPYGITSRENVQNNPRNSSAYYGGSIYVHYSAAEPDDNRPMRGSLIENSILEITLSPEDGEGKSFVIRQPVGFAGNVTINNIPLGRYKITAKAGGKTLALKENRKFNPLFGLSPAETTGAASILFAPNQAQASMIAPQNGAWNSINLDVSMP